MLEKKYIVYSKWFGEDFSNLSIGKEIKQLMKDVLYETKIKQIENHLMNLYNAIIKLHNSKNDLPSITNRVTDFYGRPIKVIMAESIVEKIINSISSEKVRKINVLFSSVRKPNTSHNREYKVPLRSTQIASGRKLPTAISCTLRTLYEIEPQATYQINYYVL